MKIYNSIEEFSRVPNAVVTSGTFDGVHLGHKKVIKRITKIANQSEGDSVIITFWPHPRLVLFPDQKDLKLLNTFEEKAALLEGEGIRHLLKIPFTKEFSFKSSNEFIKDILVEVIGTKKLVIGYDHRFGKNREGSFIHLKENADKYGFAVEEIPKQEIEEIGVSSTLIRKAYLEGNISIGNQYLGRPYSISGKVIKGDQLGRQMGFPTANLEVDDKHKLIPADGIYAVKVGHGDTIYEGMLYIGNRPTLKDSIQSIEVNIFNFEHEIYNESITLYFYHQIREDAKFNNLEDLKMQLEKDKLSAQTALKAT